LVSFVRMGYLREPWLKRTNKVKMIFEDFNRVFERNSHVTRVIDEVVSTYADISTNRLVEMVYKMPWARNRIINDLAIGVPMLYPLKRENAREVFAISENELEDLEICLNPKLSREMDQAFNEMRRGRLLSHAEVFG